MQSFTDFPRVTTKKKKFLKYPTVTDPQGSEAITYCPPTSQKEIRVTAKRSPVHNAHPCLPFHTTHTGENTILPECSLCFVAQPARVNEQGNSPFLTLFSKLIVISTGTISPSLMQFSMSSPYCEPGLFRSSRRRSPAERCVQPYF